MNNKEKIPNKRKLAEEIMETIITELEQINNIIMNSNPTKLTQQIWRNFSNNYLALFRMSYDDAFTNQFGQTFRYLIECAADAHMLEEFSLYDKVYEYILQVDRYQTDKTKSEKNILNKIVKFDIGEEASKKGWMPPNAKNSNKKEKYQTGHNARVQWVFGNNSSIIYSYCSCFVHFNIIGLAWSNKQDKNNFFSAGLIQSIIPLETMVHSIGKSVCNESLINYSAASLKTEIQKMVTPQNH